LGIFDESHAKTRKAKSLQPSNKDSFIYINDITFAVTVTANGIVQYVLLSCGEGEISTTK